MTVDHHQERRIIMSVQVGDIGRIVQPGARGDWGKDFKVRQLVAPSTVLDDIAGDRTSPPSLTLVSTDLLPNGLPAEQATVPAFWFKPGGK
jgi:hypothetical protein